MAKRKTYPGNLAKRGRGYRWQVCVGGQRHRETFVTLSQRDAEKLARERYRHLERQAERRQDGLPTGLTMQDLLDEFERDIVPTLSDGTQRAYRDSLKALRLYWVDEAKNPRVERVRKPHVKRFMTWRRSHRIGGGEVAVRTVEKDRAVLHRIFEHAEGMEYREGNPVARKKGEKPKYDGRSPVILDANQYERLLLKCGDRDILRAYILTLGETGERCESEALWMRWEDVDIADGFLRVVSGRNGHRTKSGKSRWVPMTPRLRKAMQEHFARYRLAIYDGKRTPWVFHHTQTRRHHRAGERIRSLYSAFKNAAKRAKLPTELVQHDLRHRRVTTWLADGKDVVKVKEAVGHSDLRTTMLYTHLVKENLRGLVEQESEREPLRDLA